MGMNESAAAAGPGGVDTEWEREGEGEQDGRDGHGPGLLVGLAAVTGLKRGKGRREAEAGQHMDRRWGGCSVPTLAVRVGGGRVRCAVAAVRSSAVCVPQAPV